MVETMLHVYNNYEESLEKAENAYNWVTTDLNWQTGVVPIWVELFDRVYDELQEDTVVEIPGNRVIKTEEF
jgi:hypothetical protein